MGHLFAWVIKIKRMHEIWTGIVNGRRKSEEALGSERGKSRLSGMDGDAADQIGRKGETGSAGRGYEWIHKSRAPRKRWTILPLHGLRCERMYPINDAISILYVHMYIPVIISSEAVRSFRSVN